MLTAILTNNANSARPIAKTMDLTPTSSAGRDFVDECEAYGITFGEGAAFIPRQDVEAFRKHITARGEAGAFEGYHYSIEDFVDFLIENPNCDLWLTDS